MIQHHAGALKMVDDLFATPRAGQEVDVNVFANDVVTVQTAEIGIMQQMLHAAADEVSHDPPTIRSSSRCSRSPCAVIDCARRDCSSRRRSRRRRPIRATTDPRSNLKPGRLDAGVAASNMRLVSFSPKPAQFDTARGLTFINSDLAFGGNYVYQGNFAGFTIWDVSNPAKPVIVVRRGVHHVAGRPVDHRQPAVHLRRGRAATATTAARAACRTRRTTWPASASSTSPIPTAPKLDQERADVQRLAHAHGRPEPDGQGHRLPLRVGQQGARPETELAGCKNGTDPADPTNSLYQLDVIKVPLDHPEQAAVMPGARIFTGLDAGAACARCAPADAASSAARRRGDAPRCRRRRCRRARATATT